MGFLEMKERLKSYGERKFREMNSVKPFTDKTHFCIVLTAPASTRRGKVNSMLAVDIRRISKKNKNVLTRPAKKTIKRNVANATETIHPTRKSTTRASVTDVFCA